MWCCCAAAAAHDPLLFLKFPLESVIFGRISKIRTFFNSARKVRKNGIGPIKISQKKFQSQKCVDAFLSLLFFILPAIWGKKKRIMCVHAKSRSNFFSLILMGPIPFFLTFRAELKKISKKIIRPKMTDSTGNFGFVHKGGEGQQQHTHSKKIEIFQIANRPQWPIPSSVPHWPWLKKMDFRALARALRCARARDSALEAFRHNPTDGGFATTELSFEYYTKCPSLRFLSYWAGLLSQRGVISRVKATCLTTV